MQFTLCFLTRGDNVLLLHRNNPPNQGLWNGVGGHIEPGETPRQSCLREVQEETGYTIPSARFAGVLTWEGFEYLTSGGIYLFTAPAPPGEPTDCAEGKLAWKSQAWLGYASQVVSNLHYCAPQLLANIPPCQYHFVYRNSDIISHTIRPLNNDLMI